WSSDVCSSDLALAAPRGRYCLSNDGATEETGDTVSRTGAGAARLDVVLLLIYETAPPFDGAVPSVVVAVQAQVPPCGSVCPPPVTSHQTGLLRASPPCRARAASTASRLYDSSAAG